MSISGYYNGFFSLYPLSSCYNSIFVHCPAFPNDYELYDSSSPSTDHIGKA